MLGWAQVARGGLGWPEGEKDRGAREGARTAGDTMDQPSGVPVAPHAPLCAQLAHATSHRIQWPAHVDQGVSPSGVPRCAGEGQGGPVWAPVSCLRWPTVALCAGGYPHGGNRRSGYDRPRSAIFSRIGATPSPRYTLEPPVCPSGALGAPRELPGYRARYDRASQELSGASRVPPSGGGATTKNGPGLGDPRLGELDQGRGPTYPHLPNPGEPGVGTRGTQGAPRVTW